MPTPNIKAQKRQLLFSFIAAAVIEGVYFLFDFFFPNHSWDIIVTEAILIIVFYLFDFSKTKYKILLRVFGIFILANLLLFPYMYLFLINNDKESFTVESNLKSYIKKQELLEIEKSIDKNSIATNLGYIDKIVNSKSSSLFDIVNIHNGDLYKVDTFYLMPFIDYEDIANFKELTVFGSSGKKIFNLRPLSGQIKIDFEKQNLTVKQMLFEYQNLLRDEMNNYTYKKTMISKDNIWSYLTILPYTFNVFGNNLKPQSSLANWLVSIHWIVGITILLSLITTVIYTTLQGFSKTNTSDH